MDQLQIREAEIALSKKDKLLGELIARQRLPQLAVRHDYFGSLCRSIVGQQVSVAAARAIFERLTQKTGLTPGRIAEMSVDDIKQIGLSRSKAGYIMDLSEHFMTNPGVYNHLEHQSDEDVDVIKELTAIKGIGVWTAQMFLIFTLGRIDVFAPDDVGLFRAMKKLYGWESMPPKDIILATSLNWQPYRTIASLHLWQSLNNDPYQ